MRGLKLNIMLGLLLIVLSWQVMAKVSVILEVPSSFKEGDIISFDYVILSDKEERISYIAYIDCPNAEQQMLAIRRAKLKENIALEEKHYYGIVTPDIEPQTCKAVVSLLNPSELTEGQDFEVFGKPTFDLDLLLCKSQSCEEKAKVFNTSDTIYIGFSTNVDNPLITGATITYPDSTLEQINLPASIEAEQVGAYILEVMASKEGYQETSKTEVFAVIEKSASIQQESNCNSNGVCEGTLGENQQTCPQDCFVEQKIAQSKETEVAKAQDTTTAGKREESPTKVKKSRLITWIYIIAVIILFCVLLVSYQFMKSRKQPPQQGPPQQINTYQQYKQYQRNYYGRQ